MRSATSFFDKTMIRTDVRRFWPLWVLYTGIWVIMLPVYQWVDLYLSVDYPGDQVYNSLTGGLVMAVAFGCLLPMALFSYLMNSRSLGLMHALPVSRTSQFISHTAAGLGMMASGKLVVALMSLVVQALRMGEVDIKALLIWFVVLTAVELFFFALGTFCCMITGWLLAMPVLYAAANVAAYLLTALLQLLGNLFYFGYCSPGRYPAITRWLTPAYQLGEVLGDHVREVLEPVESLTMSGDEVWMEPVRSGPRIFNPEAVTPVLVYTAVALVLLGLAWLLYQRRASESAGDPVAFGWARPIIRYTISLYGGLSMGYGLYAMLNMNSDEINLALLLVCLALVGAVCCLAAEMVIRKSFRIFRKGWKSAAAVALVLIAICVCAKLDVFGYEKRMPAREDITSVEINFSREGIYVNECVDEETIEAILALHEAIIARGELPTGDDSWYDVRIEYEKADGSEFRRDYTLSWEKTEADPVLYEALNRAMNTTEIRYKNTLGGNVFEGDLQNVELRGGYITGKGFDLNHQLTADEAQRLFDAVLTDLDNGAGEYAPMTADELPWCTVYLELDDGQNTYWFDSIKPDFTETVKVLVSLGLEEEQIFQWEDNEKYGW